MLPKKTKEEAMPTYKVTLSQEECDELKRITKTGSHKSQKVVNGLILLNCDEGEYSESRSTNQQIATILKVSMRKIDRVKKRLIEEGFEVALNGRKSQRNYERKADGDVEAHLIALSCSNPPSGFERWSLRLLADKAVELQYVESISYETVRRVLKKTLLSRGRKKDG